MRAATGLAAGLGCFRGVLCAALCLGFAAFVFAATVVAAVVAVCHKKVVCKKGAKRVPRWLPKYFHPQVVATAEFVFFELMATDQKREAMIGAALRRFSHFGVPKTTMSEIAADLSISKPLLYYYFPDKMSLYAAVLAHIIDEDSARQQPELDRETDPVRAMDRYLEFRTDFILKYYQLLEHLKSYTPQNMPESLVKVFEPLRRRELDRIAGIMEKGQATGLFKIENARKTAELFFDFLDGFRFAFLAQQQQLFPDKKQFASILRKEKEFSHIFMNGLTCVR
ncbi:MAG: TetR/AcrR family transcriptional regulator [Chitinophagaceae bacterium]|nr:MAG: TetR/AcrR family transcriptional regulator [Chitinophagaceae bacterium]